MKKNNQWLLLYKIGGINLVLCKILDRLLGRKTFALKLYDIFKMANSIEYHKLLTLYYEYVTHESINIDKPKTFNEKIQWLKIYDTSKLKTDLSDKLLVRGWIEKKIGSQYLIPLLGDWGNFDEINFNKLPESFVLKCNHGSGWNIVVKNKNNIDLAKVKKCFDKWMKLNFAFALGLELQYKDIKPRIIAEKYIEEIDSSLFDYKIHVFDGLPKIIQVIGDRNLQNHTAQEAFFDTDWNQIDLMYRTYDTFKKLPKKPDNLTEMLRIAAELGKDFKYVRVDLYNISNKILFGEMTFTPMSGFGKWNNIEDANLVGSWIPTCEVTTKNNSLMP